MYYAKLCLTGRRTVEYSKILHGLVYDKMKVLFMVGALVFCLLGSKLVSRTQKSGRIWLNGFVLACFLLPVIGISVHDKNADGDMMAFIGTIGGSIGVLIGLAIDAYLET